MGMDIYGNKPKTQKGEYFRNNVWWWHTLWDYCCTVDPTLIEKVPYAHHNDGDGLNATDARKLAIKLQTEIDTGRAKQYVDEYEKYRTSIPKENCTLCDQNGERIWQQENGEPYKKTCNACQGTKKVDSWATHYYINLDNIQEFTEFLTDSGGFKIW